MQTENLVVVLFLALFLVGCSTTHKLMPTPNIYTNSGNYPEEGIPHGLKSNEINLLFVTDRDSKTSADSTLEYGYGRSASMGFGSAIVEIGNDLTWKELVELSETS
jgi:esterase/lipase superfamily enzyme